MIITRAQRLLTAGLLLPLFSACTVEAGEQRPTPVAESPAAAAQPLSQEQEQFWAALTELCGQAFEGRVIEAPAGDTTFVDRRLVMHVRECDPEVIRIPFHVGADRSRTWVLTRLPNGIRLKHDHRHEDGSEDEVTMYGGDTAAPGTAQRQEFPADAHTASLIPAARTNVWTVEVVPGRMYAYALRREGTDRRFRVEFDLTNPVPAPPAPWGFEG
jgi:hypothetical protein